MVSVEKYSNMSAANRELLPDNITPKAYDLMLEPDLALFKFDGKVVITAQVKTVTKCVVLHAAELKMVGSAKVAILQTGAQVESTDTNYDEAKQTVTFHFDNELPVGELEMSICFEGIINDKLAGFYRSKYKTKDGQLKYAAVTQFEPTDCRKAFPCYDEPALKATFNIHIKVKKGLMALSNMPIESSKEEEDGERVCFSYKKTPVMSTYILAFVVGEYDYLEKETEHGVKVRVYTEPGKHAEGKFALDVACKTLDYYDKYFDIKYPLEKLDMVAVSDFGSGAMENWGLVTYRETALLINEKTSPLSSKERVAYVVAHELAHQWFGNLVTMEWWDDLWLNEGFATWIGSLATDYLFPEWNMWTRFVQQYTGTAMNLDSLESSHPIEVPIENSNQVNDIFDAISYYKGAAAIRMLVDCMGEDAFQKGIQAYLKKHMYQNARTNDLWEALSSQSNRDVSKLMKKWTLGTGYPVITASRDNASNTLTLSQERFLSSGKKIQESTPWEIYIRILGEDNQQYDFTMTEFSTTIALPEHIAKSKWLKLNPGSQSFYRVNYDSNMYEVIGAAIENNCFSPIDRLNIINDTFALAQAGYLDCDMALSIVSKFQKETQFSVWAEINSNIGYMMRMFECHDNFEDLKLFIKNLYQDIFKVVTWDQKEGENLLYSNLRPIVIKTLGTCGDENVIMEAKKRFVDHLEMKQTLDPNLKLAVYCIVVAHGGEKEFGQVKNILMDNNSMHEERIRALQALGNTEDEKLITVLLNMSLNSDEVRPSDAFKVFASLSTRKVGRDMAWDFMKKNFSTFIKKFGGGQFILSNFISSTTKNFSSKEMEDDVHALFEEYKNDTSVVQCSRTIQQSIESIVKNTLFLEREVKNFEKFFSGKDAKRVKLA